MKSNKSETSNTPKTLAPNESAIGCEESVRITTGTTGLQSSSSSTSSSSTPSSSSTSLKTNQSKVNRNTILVNPNQSANKLLKHFRYVGYELNESISPAHYLMYDSSCALFLSLKYHVIYPNYIYDKLNELRNSYQLKVLLVLVDHIEFQSSLKELTKLAIRTNSTLMLAWSYEEAANYLENYKLFAGRTPDIIMGKINTNSDVSQTAYQCLVEALTSIKSINKTDAVSLISTFDTFENIVKTDEEELTLCPGMASLKV